jgi:hypothetical protein
MRKVFLLCFALSSAAAAAPSLAQYPYQDRSRAGRVADEIARTVEDTAVAVGRVRDSVDQSLGGLRYRGPERFAVDACRPQVERYGRMRVQDVLPYKRSGFRVYGSTEGFSSGYDGRYRRGQYGPRRFTCTVREDGRVKLSTKRLSRYRY